MMVVGCLSIRLMDSNIYKMQYVGCAQESNVLWLVLQCFTAGNHNRHLALRHVLTQHKGSDRSVKGCAHSKHGSKHACPTGCDKHSLGCDSACSTGELKCLDAFGERLNSCNDHMENL